MGLRRLVQACEFLTLPGRGPFFLKETVGKLLFQKLNLRPSVPTFFAEISTPRDQARAPRAAARAAPGWVHGIFHFFGNDLSP